MIHYEVNAFMQEGSKKMQFCMWNLNCDYVQQKITFGYLTVWVYKNKPHQYLRLLLMLLFLLWYMVFKVV